jgi:hypothetical protein
MEISFRDIKIYHEDYFFDGKCLKIKPDKFYTRTKIIVYRMSNCMC